MEYPPGGENKYEEPTGIRPDAKSQDKGYIGRLEARLRELAGRLHELEGYKLLCERKILELIPGHPLPVKTAHLGKTIAKGSSQELNALRQKVEKLTADNKQLRLAASKKIGKISEYSQEEIENYQARIEGLEKEKAALEESLRGEMLIGEEQRNYIEILKEALESKVEDLGIGEFLSKAAGEGRDPSEVFAQMAIIKKGLDERRKELARSEGDIADMEELIVDLKKQTEDQKLLLENVHNEYSKAIKDKEVTSKGLEEMKISVLTICKNIRWKNYRKITKRY